MAIGTRFLKGIVRNIGMDKSKKSRFLKDNHITRRVLRNSMSRKNFLDVAFKRGDVVRAFADEDCDVYYLLFNRSFRWEGTREGYEFWSHLAEIAIFL